MFIKFGSNHREDSNSGRAQMLLASALLRDNSIADLTSQFWGDHLQAMLACLYVLYTFDVGVPIYTSSHSLAMRRRTIGILQTYSPLPKVCIFSPSPNPTKPSQQNIISKPPIPHLRNIRDNQHIPIMHLPPHPKNLKHYTPLIKVHIPPNLLHNLNRLPDMQMVLMKSPYCASWALAPYNRQHHIPTS
jgi:hypothetical protein